MYTVYQHWDPLLVCVVGRSYPPEFYSWVTHTQTRTLLEKIAIETEEDYQKIVCKLQDFGVKVLRPDCANVVDKHRINRAIPPPPMTPRDQFVMISDTFYRTHQTPWEIFYNNIKDAAWPHVHSIDSLSPAQQQECRDLHQWGNDPLCQHYNYQTIIDDVTQQANIIKRSPVDIVTGSMVSRIGRDLYFGTNSYNDDLCMLKKSVDLEFPDTRNHIVNTGGHGDGSYCPVCPGLIISLRDVPTYADTFPGWEVVYLPGQSWNAVKPFLDLKAKNGGRWWIQDEEISDHFIKFVDTWMSDWVGYVEETVFDVNMLIIDPHNVIVFGYDKLVFDALERHDITPHVVPFRHRYFWDGGIHCVTLDLHRQGTQQDYFPERG